MVLLGLGGIDPRLYLHSRWPDDRGILEALAEETLEVLQENNDQLALKIANRVMDGLNG